ncbi:OmpW family outer membrane protein [Chryseobacterium sp. MP_3.2]|uniref:OmpW family outer membrane protein n=1 Tax=Chryseobacterium sp. MP_3.2 TaxID=3071712 RepID=UPI002E02AE70|nr:outer membrane protein [Chryseobacterium sp. MP_3.2]
MKKMFLVGAVALFATMNAQTEKGSWVVGGSTTLGFNSVSTKYSAGNNSESDPKISTFTITPSVGYFVIDKLAVGLDLGYTSISTKDDNENVSVSTTSVLPTATYYFKSASNLIPYLGAGIGYASQKTEYGSEDLTLDGFAWKAKGGLVYLINQNVGVDLGLGYNQFVNTQDETEFSTEYKTTTSTLGVNVGFTLFLK